MEIIDWFFLVVGVLFLAGLIGWSIAISEIIEALIGALNRVGRNK